MPQATCEALAGGDSESTSSVKPQFASFKEGQKDYFITLLERKWACDTPGHTVCLPVASPDGDHHRLSHDDLASWANELCRLGDPIPSSLKPPIRSPVKKQAPTVSALQHVSTPSSRRHRPKSITLAASASLRSSLRQSESTGASSGVPGIGYYSGKALKLLGERTLDALEQVVMFKKTCQHRYLLRRLERTKGVESGNIKDSDEKDIFEMIEDALEMSRPCYSARVNTFATHIGWRMDKWLESTVKPVLPNETTASLFSQVYVCLPPLDSLEVSKVDPSTGDMAWELLNAVTKVPLALKDPDATLTVIRVLSRELAHAPYSSRHMGLGHHLTRIIQTTSQLRLLTPDELDAIHTLAARRVASVEPDPVLSRPWEVVIFAHCAAQDPWLSRVVRGRHGLSSIVSSLRSVLSKDNIDQWKHLDNLTWALAVLLRNEYLALARIVDVGILDSLVDVLGRKIPEHWSRIRDHVLWTIAQIVAQQPNAIDKESFEAPVMSGIASVRPSMEGGQSDRLAPMHPNGWHARRYGRIFSSEIML